MLRTLFVCVLLAGCAALPDVEERSLLDIVGDVRAGRVRAEDVTAAYVRRIERIDRAGPTLRSVLAFKADAGVEAEDEDNAPLLGAPILIKDNIETRDFPTTAGSLALAANSRGVDAPLVERLRAAGAVVFGKANLSEWSNFRSTRSISGWSAVGGLARNPYALDRNACGSSSGSAAAVAASLAAAAIGTETWGSIICPASVNGVVGLKPTVGLVSRTGIVPISHSMDTAGPITRTVEDAAFVLSAIAGSDATDPATAEADARKSDYVAALNEDALVGKRLGVLRIDGNEHPDVRALFERALGDLREAGAELVEVESPPVLSELTPLVRPILLAEFKAGIAKMLAESAAGVETRTLEALIAFNAREPRETPLFGQELFELAREAPGLDDAGYVRALSEAKRMAGRDGIDRMLAAQRLDALVTISESPAWPSDPAGASRSIAGGDAGVLAAVAGYPHLTVPMGLARGLPVGLSFMGAAWSEAQLLAMGYAYEQRTQRRMKPSYARTLNETREFAPALAATR